MRYNDLRIDDKIDNGKLVKELSYEKKSYRKKNTRTC
jgi:hypothetical protein